MVIMSNVTSDEELLRMMIDFYGSEFTKASPERKQEFLDSYRKVEAEHNKQIELAGGVKNWYASGQGRLI